MNTQALYMFLLSLEVLFLFLIELYISMIGRGLLDLHSPVDSYKLLIVKLQCPQIYQLVRLIFSGIVILLRISHLCYI